MLLFVQQVKTAFAPAMYVRRAASRASGDHVPTSLGGAAPPAEAGAYRAPYLCLPAIRTARLHELQASKFAAMHTFLTIDRKSDFSSRQSIEQCLARSISNWHEPGRGLKTDTVTPFLEESDLPGTF